MTLTFLNVLWFILIFVLVAGYFILDGFDLGIGVLSPWLGKDDGEKAILRFSVGPVWDGNEVWLLTAGGALFAAFAPAYATTFSGFYLAIMLVLFGLIIRAVALEFRAHDPEMKKLWDILFFVGSFLPALLFGVAVGNVLNGLPLEPNGDYLGGLFPLLNPFSLLCGLLGLAVMCLQGLSWTAVKTLPGSLHDRAVAWLKPFQIAVAVLFVLATVLYFAVVKAPLEGGIVGVLRIVFVAVVVLSLVASVVMGRQGKDLATFLTGCGICIGLVGLTAASLFPNIIPATDPALSITIAQAASSDLALTCMTIITCVGLPLVLAYHIIIYRTFAGKIEESDY